MGQQVCRGFSRWFATQIMVTPLRLTRGSDLIPFHHFKALFRYSHLLSVFICAYGVCPSTTHCLQIGLAVAGSIRSMSIDFVRTRNINILGRSRLLSIRSSTASGESTFVCMISFLKLSQSEFHCTFWINRSTGRVCTALEPIGMPVPWNANGFRGDHPM
jgi:hypothetical protein